MIGTKLGPYEITAKLGEGGMGEVWRGRDSRLDRDVAIKVLPEAFVEDAERLARFEREAKVLAQLNHPNIAHVYGMEASGESHAFVMELVEGPTLAERLEQGALPLDESLLLARQIAEALEEAHEKGIVHRDLKPQNVKVTADGRVKVLDFGLAKAMDPADGAPGSASRLAASPTLTLGATIQGVILGTAAYMSPEQAKGAAVDKRADIWAFGVVLYEMLTGASLFAGDTVPETLAGVLKNEIDLASLPEDTPPALRRLLRRCLERQPRERLRDIGDARLVLDELLSGKEEGGAHGSAGGIATPRRSVWGIAAVAATIGALAALGAVTLLGVRSAMPAPQRAIRATVELPEPWVIQTQNPPVALSPDGTRLALAVQGRGNPGGRELQLRSLDRLDLQPLAGTEGAEGPFWSPDSRSLGFFAGGKLKRLDLADGIVRTLCDAPAGRGGTWSPLGTIVFAPSATGPLSQVPEGGGEPAPFTTLASEGEMHRLPHFLPGGRKIVFLVKGRQSPSEHAVYAFDPESGVYAKVRDSKTEALFVAPGHLAFVADENLMLQPFDVERLALTGAARPLASDVQYSETRNFVAFAVAADGRLVYQSTARRRGMELAWLDRDGARVPVAAEPVAAYQARVSPDGGSVALSLYGDHFEMTAGLLDLDRGIRTARGDRTLRAGGGAWSPDGETLAFGYESEGQWQLGVSRARARDAIRPLTSGSGNEQTLGDFTPDGRAVLFEMHSNVDKLGDLYVVDVDGTSAPRPYLVRAESDMFPRLSPDGRWVAFTTRPPEAVRSEMNLAIAPFPEATEVFQVTDSGVALVGWLGDGEPFWVDNERRLWSATLALRAGRLEVGRPRALLGGAPLPRGTTVFDYSLRRARFLIGEALQEAPANRLVVVTDWRAALAVADRAP